MLLEEKAIIDIYDPKVSEKQILTDINSVKRREDELNKKSIVVNNDPYEACKDSHAVAILTEWDEFKSYDWNKIYQLMKKPAFIFDGRNIIDKISTEKIGFIYHGLGK